MRHLVIYHAHCTDGFGAAWAAFHSLGATADYLPWSYGDHILNGPVELEEYYDVYIVDFSFDRETLVEIGNRCTGQVTVLDHHRTAEQALSNWVDRPSNVSVLFDMTRSGAAITWDFFHSVPRPKIISYIQDRDLWTWALPDSKKMSAYLSILPHTFGAYDEATALIENSTNVATMMGTAVLAYQEQTVAKLIERVTPVTIRDHRVVAVNSSVLGSEVGHALLMAHPELPFVAIYFDLPGKRVWSLRARTGGFDVSEVAKSFGGGGHAAAAGFTLPVSPLALESNL